MNKESLFAKNLSLGESSRIKPLAYLLRPQKLSDFVGQKHLVGHGGILKKMIENDQITSLIFWGPPGCGKTTLAYLISKSTKSKFEYLSAVNANLKDLKALIDQARIEKTILCVDEVHRWNRTQQSALLPYIEDGTLIFIGCTTENPYFEVIGPLISRCIVYKLEPLSDSEIEKILRRGIEFLELKIKFKIEKSAEKLIIKMASGDARRALNLLEGAYNFIQNVKPKIVTPAIVEKVIQKRVILYDKDRDAHYDTISAFIKSMRGSDPDAAVFYLVKMLEAGEDPKFIARRIFILASEDIGNADPNALNVAASTFSAVEKIGLPEAEFALAQAAIYMATAPKSNSTYKALSSAKNDLEKKGFRRNSFAFKKSRSSGFRKI